MYLVVYTTLMYVRVISDRSLGKNFLVYCCSIKFTLPDSGRVFLQALSYPKSSQIFNSEVRRRRTPLNGYHFLVLLDIVAGMR